MPIINFMPRFVPAIEAGIKQTTFRPLPPKDSRYVSYRYKPPKQGDTLQIYTGLRTKEARKIGEAIVVDNTTCELTAAAVVAGGRSYHDPADLKAIANLDGFENYKKMFDFLCDLHKKHRGQALRLQRIAWDNFTPSFNEG